MSQDDLGGARQLREEEKLSQGWKAEAALAGFRESLEESTKAGVKALEENKGRQGQKQCVCGGAGNIGSCSHPKTCK